MPEADAFLHFGCPQCTARLRAPKRRAGTRGRCPWCQYVFIVPQESHFPGRAETYALHGPDWRPPDETGWPLYIAVRCALCGTRMVASEEEAGQWIECPDCGTTTQVPPKSHSPPSTPAAPSRPAEIYPIYEGPGQPPQNHPVVHGRYLPIFCRQCSTRMLATADQVGQSLVCPDCGAATVVPPTKEAGPKDLPARPAEIYALRQTDTGALLDEKSPEDWYAFPCSTCGTRLHATPAEKGQTIICPDCATPVVVPPPPHRPPPAVLRKEPADIYEVRPAAERPPIDVPGYEAANAPQPPQRPSQPETGRSAGQKAPSAVAAESPTSPQQPSPSPRPTSQRLDEPLGFLLSPGVRNLWLFLSVGLALFFSCVGEARVLIPSNDGRVMFLGLVMLAFAGLVAVVIFVVGSAYLLTLLQETAAGCDQIEDWPDNFLDYLLQGFVIVVAGAVAVGLSVGLDRLATDAGMPRGIALAAGTFLLFPLLLLCILETGLPFMPFSVPILRSVLAAWPAWLGFYLRAGVLVGLAVGASVCALVLAGFWAILPAAAVLGAAVILYFRLLGRLASQASHRLADSDTRRKKKRRPPDDPLE